MENKEIKELLARYQAGNATDQDKAFLESWYQNHNQEWIELSEEERVEDTDLVWAAIGHKIRQKQPRRLWYRITAAASILLILSFGAYFLTHRHDSTETFVSNSTEDIAPGSDKAIITLANGQKIAVANAKNGLLANQGNTAITLQGNKVIYKAGGDAGELQYNTLTTPRGGQYPLTLSDGTKVWLDAESSITYPVAFVGNERPVKITGQVYFEVAHDPARPFRVTANNQTVEVLGTHFNINAYSDEPSMNTTLLEGSVKITANGDKAILIPGQQAQINRNKLTIKSNVDLGEAIAWHKGMFQFNKADIPTVMRQLARWYDVDVDYEGKIPDHTFSGKIYRNVTALKVSDILSYEKIHFRIEGRKIIVMP